MRIPSGSTTNRIHFIAVDDVDGKTRLTGLSSFTVTRSRNGGTPVAYTTPTIVELDNSTMPGSYALLVDEDTTLPGDEETQEYQVDVTHAGMRRVSRVVELFNPPAIELTDEQLDDLGETISNAVSEQGFTLATGGGTLNARLSFSTLYPRDYLEIVQGEERTLTLIVEPAERLFVSESPTLVRVKFMDPDGNVVLIEEEESDVDTDNGSIDRVTEQFDVFICRVTISSEQTAMLEEGVQKVEITLDDQKARLNQSIKIISQIPDE